MSEIQITGRLGGSHSQLGNFALGYDSGDEVVVVWIGMRKDTYDSDPYEMIFGYDEGGFSVQLFKDQPTILTRAQALQAIQDGAILKIVGRLL